MALQLGEVLTKPSEVEGWISNQHVFIQCPPKENSGQGTEAFSVSTLPHHAKRPLIQDAYKPFNS